MKTKTVILISIFIFASLYAMDALCSDMNDKVEELSINQSSVFSPGYINAAKQKTEAIIGHLDAKKSFIDRIIENVRGKMFDKVTGDAYERMEPELKHKTAPTGENAQVVNPAAEAIIEDLGAGIGDGIIDTPPDKVNIGSGTDQWYYLKRTIRGQIVYQPVKTPTDMLVTEVINGTRYWYLGFNDFGGVQNANIFFGGSIRDAKYNPLMKAGDTILIKSGSIIDITTSASMVNGPNKNIYGGYLADGTRDASGSRSVLNLNGSFTIANAKISGVEIKGNLSMDYNTTAINCKFFGDVRVLGDSKNVNLKGNVFEKTLWTDSYNSITAINNQFSDICVGKSSQLALKDNKIMGNITVNGSYYGKKPGYDVDGNPGYIIDTGVIYFRLSKITSVNNEFSNGSKINLYGSQIASQDDHFAGGSTFNGVNGDSLSNISFRNTVDSSTGQSSMMSLLNTRNLLSSQYDYMSSQMMMSLSSGKAIDGSSLGNIFRGLLANKDAITAGGQAADAELMRRLFVNMANESALAAPAINFKDPASAQMESAIALANILRNPTEDQKAMIDAVTMLITEADKLSQDSDNPELKKAEGELVQMVAAVLLAQAIPDLLGEDDMANIKGIFKDLSRVKESIIKEYDAATAPYYDGMKKAIIKNMESLQLSNVLSSSTTDRELENMPRNEIDKIFEKIRKLERKSFEAEYILQEEAKARSRYIDPSKQKLTGDMKKLLNDVARQLNSTLNGKGVVTKK